MALDDRKLWAEVHRDQQGVQANGTNGPLGCTRRGYLHTAPMGKPTYNLAEQGQYFVATNATPGTGIAGIAAADGNDDLENLLHVLNEDTAAGGKRIYMDYLRLRWTAAGANGTNVSYVMKTDSVTRYTSGGTAITEVNPNRDSTGASIAGIVFGAIVSPAATAQRLVDHGILRSVIAVVGDTCVFDFGGVNRAAQASLATAGTAQCALYVAAPPVIIGPAQSFMLAVNAASQSAASSFEFAMGWWEV